jgi:hypothetical protein
VLRGRVGDAGVARLFEEGPAMILAAGRKAI